MLFSDRKPDILLAVGNRADLDTAPAPTRLDRWMRDCYISIGMKYAFSELEVSLNITLTANYDTIDYPADCRAIKAFTAYDPSTNLAIPIELKDIAYVRKYPTNTPVGGTAIPNVGPPSIAAPFAMSLILRPVPMKNYQATIDYWQKPQIGDPISSTVINLPDDWLEIFDYMVQLRVFHALKQNDMAQQIQQLLFGYRTDQGRMIPGLIAEAETRRQQQAKWMDYGIAPRMGVGYTK